MKKTKKGLTLVEVLVGITVFSIVIFALFTAVASMRKIVFRQEEYVKIKMVCYDIDAYWDKYLSVKKENSELTTWYTDLNGKPLYVNDKKAYLTSDFKLTLNEDNAAYVIEFEYQNNSLIIASIESISSKKVFVEKLDLSKIGN